jgi:hypothetical protein
LNSFKKQILIQLGVDPDLADRTDGGLHEAYAKYKAYLQACQTYSEMKSNKSWVGVTSYSRDSDFLRISDFIPPKLLSET